MVFIHIAAGNLCGHTFLFAISFSDPTMPGARNPIVPTMSRLVAQVHDVVRRARDGMHDISKTKGFAAEKMLDDKLVDVQIQFIGAANLPKMDVVGSADPYFVAKIDEKITFV